MSNFCTLSQAKPNEQDPFKIPAYPEYPKLRLGTQLDAIYERLYRDGYGIRKPGISASILRPSALRRLIGITFGTMPVFSERLEALQFL